MSGATVRLTAAQALVRWLQVQHSERDGHVQRAVPAICGIFGHGNVLGIGQAVEQDGAALPLFQPKHEQAMVHMALGYAKASRRLATLACTASIGPGAANMLTGAGTASANRLPVLLLPGDTFASRRQGPVLQQLEHRVDADLTRQRRVPPAERVLRPRRAARAAAHGPAPGAARAARPGRDRRGDGLAAPGHAGRGVRLPRRVLRAARVARRPPAGGARPDRRGGRAAARRAAGR